MAELGDLGFWGALLLISSIILKSWIQEPDEVTANLFYELVPRIKRPGTKVWALERQSVSLSEAATQFGEKKHLERVTNLNPQELFWKSQTVCSWSLLVLSDTWMVGNGHATGSLTCILKNTNSKLYSLHNMFIVHMSLENAAEATCHWKFTRNLEHWRLWKVLW